MDEQALLANLEHRLALELGRQHIMRMRAEVERDLANQALAQQNAEPDPVSGGAPSDAASSA